MKRDPNLTPDIDIAKAKISAKYLTAKNNANKEDYSLKAVGLLSCCEREQKLVRAYERTRKEAQCLGDGSTEIREVLREKYEFLSIRQQLHKRVDAHYLKVALIMQIPVIGLIWQAHSSNTTKTSLEKTELVQQYGYS